MKNLSSASVESAGAPDADGAAPAGTWVRTNLAGTTLFPLVSRRMAVEDVREVLIRSVEVDLWRTDATGDVSAPARAGGAGGRAGVEPVGPEAVDVCPTMAVNSSITVLRRPVWESSSAAAADVC